MQTAPSDPGSTHPATGNGAQVTPEAGPGDSPARMPVLYLSPGAPPLADDRRWTGQLRDWSAHLPIPRAILVISAHWEEAPLTVSATTTVPLLYDFWGFPQHYYQVTYPAPGAPELAREVTSLLSMPGRPVHSDPTRGLDHGAYVPLVELFPRADVPVLQMSMPTLEPAELLQLGGKLQMLREQGVLIIGSGFTTHNLGAFRPELGPDYTAPAWSQEFDAWAAEAMRRRDIDGLADFLRKAPAARLAHPRTEHFAPLFVALGAADGASADSVIDGFWYGLSKRSWQLN
jgi:4,5-DOPA dioxygenase extradiol